ncbi:unconventional myosin-XVIIIa-like [Corticium candelabrum]|uniref:unconventional myosin-XVIIIa-like n=1 Tax=Corticium candelabrum TaxID=121492 RepID=UPI002E252548|nr:unconventional myosin-XVIIIa-like [Corticium candelabrum]
MKTKCAKYESDVAKAEEAKNEVIVRLSKEEAKVKGLDGQLQHKENNLRILENQISKHVDRNEFLQQQLEEVESQKQQKEVALTKMEGRLQGGINEIDGLQQRIAELQCECLTLKEAESCTKTKFEEKLQLEQQNTDQLHRHLEEEQGKAAKKEIIIQQVRSLLTFGEGRAHVCDENSRAMETELHKCRELMTLEQENHSKCKLEKKLFETKLQESESSRHALENELEKTKRELSAFQEAHERCRKYCTERNEASDELVKLGKLSKCPSSPILLTRKGAGLMDSSCKSQQKLEGLARQGTGDQDMKNPTVLLLQQAKSRSVAPVTSSGNANHVDGSSRKHLIATTSLPVNQPGVFKT